MQNYTQTIMLYFSSLGPSFSFFSSYSTSSSTSSSPFYSSSFLNSSSFFHILLFHHPSCLSGASKQIIVPEFLPTKHLQFSKFPNSINSTNTINSTNFANTIEYTNLQICTMNFTYQYHKL